MGDHAPDPEDHGWARLRHEQTRWRLPSVSQHRPTKHGIVDHKAVLSRAGKAKVSARASVETTSVCRARVESGAGVFQYRTVSITAIRAHGKASYLVLPYNYHRLQFWSLHPSNICNSQHVPPSFPLPCLMWAHSSRLQQCRTGGALLGRACRGGASALLRASHGGKNQRQLAVHCSHNSAGRFQAASIWTTNTRGSQPKPPLYHCPACLQPFRNLAKLTVHLGKCCADLLAGEASCEKGCRSPSVAVSEPCVQLESVHR